MSVESASTPNGGSAGRRSIDGTMAGRAARADGNPLLATLAFVLLKDAATELEPVAVEDIATPEEQPARKRAGGGVARAPVPT
jgi:hypothetical protein